MEQPSPKTKAELMEEQKTKIKEEVLAMVQQAEETKKTNMTDAIRTLYEAAQILAGHPSDNSKGSVQIPTPDKATPEMLYLTKRRKILCELKKDEEVAACYEALTEKILAMVEQAEETKKTDMTATIKTLYEAAQYLPSNPNNIIGSVEIPTPDKATPEMFYLSKRGNILYELKKYEKEAVACYEALKENILAMVKLAEETKNTNLPDAVKTLYEAAQFLPDLPSDGIKASVRNMTQDKATLEIQYLSKRGNILYEFKDYPGAAACYEDIKKRLPKNTRACRAYADSLRKQNRHDEAIIEYAVALRICEKDDFTKPEDSADLLNSRGLSYMEKKEYKKASDDFDAAIKINDKNPLYHCNKGRAAYALEDKATFESHLKKAKELANSGHLGELAKSNIGYINQTLEALMKELRDIENIPLKMKDPYIAARVIVFFGGFVNKLASKDNEGEKGENSEGNEIKSAKEKLIIIQEDEQLYHYYDGLMFTLSQSFATSAVVNSNLFSIETDCTPLNIVAKAISLLPLVGTLISEGITSMNAFIKETSVKKAAVNVCKFSSSVLEFDAMAQEAICGAILERQAKIKKLKDTEVNTVLLSNWASHFQDVKDKILELQEEADSLLYGERNQTPLQKLGHQTANTLVSEHIASGKIYEQSQGAIIPAKKIKKLMESALKAIDEIFELKAAPPRTKKDPKTLEDKGNSTNLEQKNPQNVKIDASSEVKDQKCPTLPEWKNNREIQTDVSTEDDKGRCESCKSCQLF